MNPAKRMRSLLLSAFFLAVTASHAAVVQPIGASSQVLIEAAGSTAGANGTFFRSDITIINLTSHNQTVTLQWLPQAGAGTPSVATVAIPALSGIRSADFVADYLHQTGLGSIIVSGTTSGGAADVTAQLFVSARIWSPQVGTNGTVSQSFPPIPVATINTDIAALFAIGGADNSRNYRVNVGVVNLDPARAQTFAVFVPGGALPTPPSLTLQTVTLPPMTMQQVALGSDVPPSTQIQVQNVTASSARSNLWTAYASTIDNITGDAWSEIAVTGVTLTSSP